MRAYIFLLTAAVLVCRAGVASADENILVGVAANYLVPFNEIAALFEKQSGIKAEPVFASTGKLYVQIIHGAPYDIFLSADEDRPNRLFKDRLAEKPFIYAIGEVVLWSSSRDACRNHKGWIDAVRYSGVRKIALANPETAPYGAAAMSALKAAGLADTLKGKFVFPQDVGQVFQYASTGAVDFGFCALSSTRTPAGKKGCTIVVEQAPKVIQAACILVRTKNRAAAGQFADFLISPAAVRVKEKYGYR